MLTIGEFSSICRVTKKTLRHYDEIGLLRPEFIAENGYRYYTASQLRTMLFIARLKGYGFSLPEVAAVLANPGDDALAERLLQKREQMATELQHTQRILCQMERDVDKLKRRIDIMDHDIIIKTAQLAPMRVYGVRKHINFEHFEEMFAQLFLEIGQKHLRPMGPPMAYYHSEEFTPEHSDVEVAVQVGEGVDGSREQPGGLHCYATLVGLYDHDAFTATYAALAKWVEENGYHINGAPFDKYVRGGEGVAPAEYITEIYFPIG